MSSSAENNLGNGAYRFSLKRSLEKLNWPKNNEIYIGEIEIFKKNFLALNPDEYDEDSQ